MPDLIDYSVWEPVSDDPAANLRAYADYVRLEHAKEGNLRDYEEEIQKGIADRAVMDGLLDRETPDDDPDKVATMETLFGSTKNDPDTDLKFLLDHYNATGDDERADTLRRYFAAKKVGYEEGEEQARAALSDWATEDNVLDAKLAAMNRGDLPFVAFTVTDEEGNTYRDIKGGPGVDPPTAEELPILLDQLLQRGALQASDLALLETKLETEPGTAAPRYVAERMRDAMNDMQAVLANDEQLQAHFKYVTEKASQKYSHMNKGTGTRVLHSLGDAFVGILSDAVVVPAASAGQTLMQGARGEGLEFGENYDKLAKQIGASTSVDPNAASIRSITQRLVDSPMGEQFSEEEIETYVGDFVKLNMKPSFDKDDPERNFLRLSNGGMVAHNALIGHAAKHDAAVDALEISDAQKVALKEARRVRLEGVATQQREQIVKLFGQDATDLFEDIRAAGGNDADFVEAYLTDEDKYSHFANSVQYLGISTLDAVVGGLAGLAMAGAALTEEVGKTVSHYGDGTPVETAGDIVQDVSVGTIGVTKDIIGGMQRWKAKQREQAAIFGEEFGLLTEVGAVIPQVAVDLLATRGIMGVTRSAGKTVSRGAARVSATKGAKALSESAIAASFSTRTKAFLRETATGQFLHKTGSIAKSIGDDLLGQSIPLAIPAFSRSYSATYTSIYNQLPDDMSHAEKHAKANGYAIGAGVNTAAIMLTFGKLGAGGVESLVTRGFSWKQMKTLYDDALNAGRVSSDAMFKQAVAQSYRGAMRHFISAGFKHPIGEGLEEGLDELVQGMIEDAALNKNSSLLERSSQFWNAATIGGILGLAGSARTYGFSSDVGNTPLLQQLRVQNEFYADVARRLSTANSPQTARTVQQLIRQTNRRAAVEREAAAAGEAAAENATSRRVPADQVNPDIWLDEPRRVQGELPLGDPRRGARIGEFPAGQAQAEFDFNDPRRSPNDPAQLEFDFAGPPPNVDPATGAVKTDLFDPVANSDQTEFDFDPNVDSTAAPTPPADPQPELDLVFDREQASLDFEGADQTTPPPAKSPEPATIRELVGRRASYGGYTGTVAIDPETGEAVLVLPEATEGGATEILLGSPDNSASALTFQSRLAVLGKGTNDFPAGTPYVRFGRNRYALPANPDLRVITDADGNPVGIVIKDARRIEGGEADVEIRVKEKAQEILNYYGLSFGGLRSDTETDLTPAEIQESLNLNPDADAMAQTEAMVPDEIKPTLDDALDQLDVAIEVDGTQYNLLEVLDTIADGNLKNAAYLEQLADIPMEVFDMLRVRLENAFDIVAADTTSPTDQRTALANTLIQLHAKLESRERAYLNYHERRINEQTRRAASAELAERGDGPTGDRPEVAPAADQQEDKSDTTGSDDPLPAPASEAAPEIDPLIQLELDFTAAPVTTEIPDGDGGTVTLPELQQQELALGEIQSDPKSTKVEKEAALRTRAKNKQKQKEASDKVQRKQTKIAKEAELRTRKKRKSAEPSNTKKQEQEAKAKAEVIKNEDPEAPRPEDVVVEEEAEDEVHDLLTEEEMAEIEAELAEEAAGESAAEPSRRNILEFKTDKELFNEGGTGGLDKTPVTMTLAQLAAINPLPRTEAQVKERGALPNSVSQMQEPLAIGLDGEGRVEINDGTHRVSNWLARGMDPNTEIPVTLTPQFVEQGGLDTLRDQLENPVEEKFTFKLTKMQSELLGRAGKAETLKVTAAEAEALVEQINEAVPNIEHKARVRSLEKKADEIAGLIGLEVKPDSAPETEPGEQVIQIQPNAFGEGFVITIDGTDYAVGHRSRLKEIAAWVRDNPDADLSQGDLDQRVPAGYRTPVAEDAPKPKAPKPKKAKAVPAPKPVDPNTAEPTVRKADNEGTWEVVFPFSKKKFRMYYDRSMSNAWLNRDHKDKDVFDMGDRLGDNKAEAIETLRARAILAMESAQEVNAAKLTEGQFRTEGERGTFTQLANDGYLMRKLADAGFKETGKGAQTYLRNKADELEAEVFKRYPKVEPSKADMENPVKSQATYKYAGQKKGRVDIPVQRDEFGDVQRATFTNDPRVTAEALKKKMSVIVPKKLRDAHNDPSNAFNINPTIDVNMRTGEVRSVRLHPLQDPIVSGFTKQVTTPYELRSLKETNEFIRALAKIDNDKDRQTIQSLQNRMFSEDESRHRFDRTVKYELAGPIADHSVEGIKNITYLQTHLRMQEAPIALAIRDALVAQQAKQEGASLDDINIPRIVRRFARSKESVKDLIEVARKAYKVTGTRGHKASDDVVLTEYGKALYKNLGGKGRFPGGRIPAPMTIARSFVKNFVHAEVARQERATTSMEGEGVAEAVDHQTAEETIRAHQMMEDEYDIVRRNEILHKSLVRLIDSDAELRFQFETMAIKAQIIDATDLDAATLIETLSSYLLTADSDLEAKQFEQNLAKTEAGQAAAAILVQAGIMPLASLRSGLDVGQMDAVERAMTVINQQLRLEEQRVYDAQTVDRDITVAAARESNERAVKTLGLKSGDTASVIEALKMIASGKAYSNTAKGTRMLQREVAKVLLANPEIISEVNFQIVDIPHTSWAGRYYVDSNTVMVNLAASNGRGLADVLLHEFLHAGTVQMLTAPRNAQQRAAVQRITRLREHAKAQAERHGFVGDPEFDDQFTEALEDNVEFLTYMLTAPRFQSILQNVSPPGNRSFLRRLADAVLRLFGIDINDNRSSQKEEAITELLDFTRMAGDNAVFGMTRAQRNRAMPQTIRNHRDSLASMEEAVELRDANGEVFFDSVAMDMPTSAVNVLHRDSAEHPRPPKRRKLAEVGEQLSNSAIRHWGRKVTSADITPEEFEQIAEMATEEFIAAYESSGKNAADWYSTSIEVAMGVAGVIHPELVDADAAAKTTGFGKAEDPQQAADLVMRMALAITSQNLTVELNTRYAEEQFAIFKETGRFDPYKKYGQKAPSISSNLAMANVLIDRLGFTRAEQVLREEFTVRELETVYENATGQPVSIDGKVDDIVNGSALFGPKIGQGFLQNIMPNFDPVTIDLWLRRTWGRWTGDVLGVGITPRNLAKFIDALRGAGIDMGPLRGLRTKQEFTKAGKPGKNRTVSEAVRDRLNNDYDFIQHVAAMANRLVTEGEQHFRLLSGPVTAETKAAMESGSMDYKTFIRQQQSANRKLDAAFKKDGARRRRKGEKAIKKETFAKKWREENGYTEHLTKPGDFKSDWALAAKVIAKSVGTIDVPSTQDRRVITALINTVNDKLAERGYDTTNADIQAVLWYPEKDLWSKLRGATEHHLNESYDSQFIRLANDRGLTTQAARVQTSITRRKGRTPRPRTGDGRTTDGRLRNGTRPTSSREAGEARSNAGRAVLATSLGYDGLGDPYDQSIDIEAEVRNAVPPGFRVEEMPDGPAAYYSPDTPGVIYINTSKMASAIDGMSEANAQAMVRSILNEEIAHAAGLDTLSEAELNALESKLGKQGLRKVLSEYAEGIHDPDAREQFIDQYEERLANGDAKARRELVHEHLRMQLQKATTGTTTEADVAFYRQNPGHWAVAFRYLKGAFSKLLQRVRMAFDPQTGRMVNRMAREVRRLNRGGRVMDNMGRMSEGAAEVAFANLDVVLATSIGANVNFDDILKIFELPVALAQGTGDYDAGGALSKRFRKSGDLDPRLYEINEVRVQIMRMIGQRMDGYSKKFDAIVKKVYGGADNAPMDVIQTAFGTTAPLLLKADYDAAENQYDADLAAIESDGVTRLAAAEAERQNGNLRAARRMEKDWYNERAARIKQAHDDKVAELDRRSDAAADAHKQAAIAARRSLPPELAKLIRDMRNEIDAFSGKVQDLDGRMSAQLHGVIDRNKGIYVTRSYRIFTEEGFADKMANDPEYAAVRDAAAKFFEKQLIKQFTDEFMRADPTLTQSAARAKAVSHIATNDLDQKAVEDFLATYDGRPGGFLKGDKTFKLDIARFMHKGDVPLELRELMGEETNPFKNAFRTYSNVGFLAANQFALNEFTRVGKANGFLVDHATVVSDPAKYKGYAPIKPQANHAYAPLAGLYAPPDLLHAFDAMFGVQHQTADTSAKQTMDKVIEFGARMTGLSLGMKTLGSIGFYIRNFLSNVLFFGPMQGYYITPAKIIAGAKYARRQHRGDLDGYVSHLISLGVIGDDVRSNTLNDMLRGHAEDPVQMQQQMNKMADKVLERTNKLIKLGKKPTVDLFNWLQKANVAIDAFHKIGLYEYELDTLRKAYPSKPQKELEQMAADKVKLTAQSYSQAPPIVRDFTRSGVGLLIAPFARFKGEVFRVGINTIKLGMDEIRSGNPVLRRRGVRRLTGFGVVIGGFSAALPMLLAGLAGVGDDEEESIRASVPDYAKNNTFFFWRDSDGKLWQTDLTFTNPFALVMDPLLRSFDNAANGRWDEVFGVWTRTVTKEFFGEQILAGTAAALRKNYDEQRGMPIYNDADGTGEKAGKALNYLFEKAFQPRMMDKARQMWRVSGMPDTVDENGKPLTGYEGAWRIFAGEFAPSKLREVKPLELSQRFIRDTFRQYSEVRNELGQLKTSRPLSEQDVHDIYNNNVNKRVKLMNKLRRVQRGFEKLGVSKSQFGREMVDARFSESRTEGVLWGGVLDRPVPSDDVLRIIGENAPDAQRRIQYYYRAIRERDRWLSLD